MKRFVPFSKPDTETSPDVATYVRTMVGRMTAGRLRTISDMAERLTFDHGYCGCEHDCCGCITSQSAQYTYAHNQLQFFITYSYNY